MISLAAATIIQKAADSRTTICLYLTTYILQTTLTTLNHDVSYKPILLSPLPIGIIQAVYSN